MCIVYNKESIMTDELRKDLERYGQVQMDTVTWVPIGQWYNYWHCYCGLKGRDEIIAEMSEKYPDYRFSPERCICNNHIYYVINIYKAK